MLAVLGFVPRWLLVGGLLFGFGFALGHVTAYRHLALEAAEARLERAKGRDASTKAASVAARPLRR
jgi:hypothetical protein